jgi:Rrf2 family protein
MKISMKTDYALRTLFMLVERYEKGPIPIREIAERNDIPKRFLEHILLDMKSQGWVDSIPGKAGGYFLAKRPAQIKMGEVVRFFDGLLAPLHCVDTNHYEKCTQEGTCRFRRVFLEIRDHTARWMDQASLETVFQNAPVRREEVFAEELIGGAGI